MKVSCKNVLCKHYYNFKKGEHCEAEATCKEYTTNMKKARKKIPKCKDCEYCRRIYTDGGKSYHWECAYNGRRKLLLMLEERACDCRL